MEWIQKLNVALGVLCTIIGLLLSPMGIWFLRNGLKNRDTVSIVIAVIILSFAIISFVGAFSLFTNGLIQFSSYMEWLK